MCYHGTDESTNDSIQGKVVGSDREAILVPVVPKPRSIAVYLGRLNRRWLDEVGWLSRKIEC